MKQKIALIGTNGIPAKYGGFETLVEYLAEHLSDNFEITVICSSKREKYKLKSYKGVNLCYINLNANGWQSILFDFISLLYSYKKFDKILILGCSGGIFMPFFNFYKNKFILNLGGLDWQRSKWNLFTRKYLKVSEELAVKFSGGIISDNEGIKKYLLSEYGVDSYVIAYGGDQAFKVSPLENDLKKYIFLDKPFAFTVARIQPDNNIEMICDSFENSFQLPLVIVGNWNNSKYGKSLKRMYSQKSNIILLDAIYDHRELNLLRSNCYIYLHGHSAGGTNPALVEAMSLGLPILAFDNEFNRYTTENHAIYFKNTSTLREIVQNITDGELEHLASQMGSIAKIKYKWSNICHKYANLFKQEFK